MGKGPSYIRFYPNFGFSFRLGPFPRWLHHCSVGGWCILRRNQHCGPKRRKLWAKQMGREE